MLGISLRDKRTWKFNWQGWGVHKYGAYLIIDPEESQFKQFAQVDKPVVLDVEDNENGIFVGLGLTWDGNRIFYFTSFPPWLVQFLHATKLVAHFGLSDLDKLQKWGVQTPTLVYDTALVAHVLDSSKAPCGLKDLAEKDLGISYPKYEQIVGKKKAKNRVTLDKQPLDLVANYNAVDCLVTYKEWQLQQKTLYPGALDYVSRLEEPVSRIFQKMEQRGIRIDLNYLRRLEGTLSVQKAEIEKQIKNDLGDILLTSPKQLLEALHAKGIKPEFKGKASTDKRALDRFRDEPVVSRLLDYSEINTLLSSFVKPYLERGQEIIHPHFNQCGTRTGRPSCSDPNLLQIPRRTDNGKAVRRMFIPREGYVFGDCDFGQIEPRILAHFSKDTAMCEMFNKGIDFHTFTSSNIGIDREKAKVLNLSVGYRATFRSVSQQLKCADSDAQTEIDKWWSLFPELKAWEDKLIWETKRFGYCTTLLGRRIKIDGLDQWNKWKREHAEKQLINNIIQGSAAEIMKLAMIECEKSDIQMLCQVYDELLWEMPKDQIDETVEKVRLNMTSCIDLDVPLTVECGVGSNWTEAKENRYEVSELS